MENCKKNNNKSFLRFSLGLFLFLVTSSWIYLIFVDGADFSVLINPNNLQKGKIFILQIFGFENKSGLILDYKFMKNLLDLTLETLQISIIAIGFATLGVILSVIPAARNVADGSLVFRTNWLSWFRFGVIRGLYMFTRAVPELIWALFIIFVFKPGILAGAITLGIHNLGVLGKLCSEVIENLDTRPIKSLVSSGASKYQVLFYGIIPMVMPKFLTYIVYRWEVIIRTTIIVGFIGAGGLGQAFKLAMSYFKYSEVGFILLVYITLVWLADLLSGLTRGATKKELNN